MAMTTSQYLKIIESVSGTNTCKRGHRSHCSRSSCIVRLCTHSFTTKTSVRRRNDSTKTKMYQVPVRTSKQLSRYLLPSCSDLLSAWLIHETRDGAAWLIRFMAGGFP